MINTSPETTLDSFGWKLCRNRVKQIKAAIDCFFVINKFSSRWEARALLTSHSNKLDNLCNVSPTLEKIIFFPEAKAKLKWFLYNNRMRKSEWSVLWQIEWYFTGQWKFGSETYPASLDFPFLTLDGYFASSDNIVKWIKW